MQIGPQRRMRKIGAKAPKGASPFPEILSYTPGEPRNSASLTPPWNGAVSGRKGVVDIADLVRHVDFLNALDDYDIALTEPPES